MFRTFRQLRGGPRGEALVAELNLLEWLSISQNEIEALLAIRRKRGRLH